MDSGLDARGMERLLHIISMPKLDGVHMIHVPTNRRRSRSFVTAVRQQAVIMSSHYSPRFRPGFNVFYLDVQDASLDSVHTIIVTRQDMIVFRFLPPIPQECHTSRQLGVIGHDGSAFTICAEIFARIEAEASGIAHCTGAPALVFGTVRLSCVFDNDEPVTVGDLDNWVHIHHEAMQVDR